MNPGPGDDKIDPRDRAITKETVHSLKRRQTRNPLPKLHLESYVGLSHFGYSLSFNTNSSVASYASKDKRA